MKLKTENLVLKSKFSGQSKTESNTTGGLSPPYSNPSNSPERQVRTELRNDGKYVAFTASKIMVTML